MSQFVIAQVWIYPVKSLGGMSVTTAPITAAGSLAGDREWVVVRPDGRMLWQGDIPRMTLLGARLDEGRLTLTAPSGDDLSIKADHGGEATAITQYGYLLPGTDAGDAAAAWLGEHLLADCRLVRIGVEAHRWGGLNPVHALSLNSLLALNERLIEQGDGPIEPNAFDPMSSWQGITAPLSKKPCPRLPSTAPGCSCANPVSAASCPISTA